MIQDRGGLSTLVTVMMFTIGLFLLGVGYYIIATEIPSPSYPTDKWEFLWFKYTEDLQDPWGKYIKKTQRTEWNFVEDYSDGEVADTGESELVGFRASRTLRVSSRTRYRLVLGSDDGIRLFIYDSDFREVTHITSGWIDRAYTEHSYERVLDEGEYKILLEWYENTDGALFTFNITSIE